MKMRVLIFKSTPNKMVLTALNHRIDIELKKYKLHLFPFIFL